MVQHSRGAFGLMHASCCSSTLCINDCVKLSQVHEAALSHYNMHERPISSAAAAAAAAAVLQV
jgi:hypothetical protein